MRELKFRLIRDGKIVGYEYHYQGVLPVGITVSILGDEHHGIYHARVGEALFKSILNHHDFIRHDSKDQFTGLTAKGVEIYEGDIVKDADSGSYGAVVWSNDKHWGYLFDTRPDYGWSHPVKGFQRNYLEVTGNIHETLLEADNAKT